MCVCFAPDCRYEVRETAGKFMLCFISSVSVFHTAEPDSKHLSTKTLELPHKDNSAFSLCSVCVVFTDVRLTPSVIQHSFF